MTVCTQGWSIQVWAMMTGFGLRRWQQEQRDKVTDEERRWATERKRPWWLTEGGWEHFKLALDKTRGDVV